MNKNRIEITKKDNYKIVAISDIHGHCALFDGLLADLRLSPEDLLIIIGDFINKGPDSITTLNRMRQLEATRPNTYILKGNHEFFLCHYLLRDNSDEGERFLAYLKEHHFQTLIHDCMEQGNFNLAGCNSMEQLRTWLLTNYPDEFNYINSRPAILFIDDLTFVHGGYSKDMDTEKDEDKLLKYDDFNSLSGVNDGMVIVGHWPTANLRQYRNTNRPYFNNDKNIISIDGGVGVKSSGELNALIIEKANGRRTINYRQQNHFEKRTILHEHEFQEEEKIFINYPHFDIEIIERGNTMSLCRHRESGKELTIFNALLQSAAGQTQVITTYINHFLNLPKGEEVELVMTYEDCALVKHGGEFGWIWTWQIV